MEQLYKFVVFEIYKNLSIKDIRNMCIVNKKFKQITRKYMQSNFIWNLNYLFKSVGSFGIKSDNQMVDIININENFDSFLSFIEHPVYFEVKSKIKEISSIFEDNGLIFKDEQLKILLKYIKTECMADHFVYQQPFDIIFFIEDKHVNYKVTPGYSRAYRRIYVYTK